MPAFFDEDKLQLDYPCSWEYKIIGADEDAVRDAVAEILGETDYDLTLSNTSRRGKYTSLLLELTVVDEAHRLGLFESLRAHEAIIMVL